MTVEPGDQLTDRQHKAEIRKQARHMRAKRLRPKIGLGLGLFLILLFSVIGAAGYFVTGRTASLPIWALTAMEKRLNQTLNNAHHLPQGTEISIGAVEFGATKDLSPKFVLRDLALLDQSGAALVQLPQASLYLSGSSLLAGEIRPSRLQLVGAQIAVERDEDGLLTLELVGLSGAPGDMTVAGVFDALDKMFSSPILSQLQNVEAEGIALSLHDARAKRSWQVGDGRLLITNLEDRLTSQFSMTLQTDKNDSPTIAQATLAWESQKNDSSAKLWTKIDQLPAADLALQAAPLAFFSVIDAPISGAFLLEIGTDGNLGRMEANLELGAGEISPNVLQEDVPKAPKTLQNTPLQFEHAALAIRYDPQNQRVTLDDLNVESQTLRLSAQGSADLLTASGQPIAPNQLPQQLVTQLQISNVMVDPDGLFESPVRFSSGSASYRLQFSPFRIELGEAVLTEGDARIRGSGMVELTPQGWEGGMDVNLNEISAESLIRLWPLSAVQNTRTWLAHNVGQGQLSSVAAALRLAPGEPAKFALDYQFSEAQVRFLRTLPPVSDGFGRASIIDNVYTLVLEGGHVTAPEGGDIDVAGSVFQVLDITQIPAQAEVSLVTDASLLATLSLLDQEPFHFITKADQPVDLGQGQAKLTSILRFPLVHKVQPSDVFFDVSGEILKFSSTSVIKDKTLTAERLNISVTPRNLTLSGDGMLNGAPISASYSQSLLRQPDQTTPNSAHVSGNFALSPENLQKLGIDTPKSWLSGQADAKFDLTLNKGKPAVLQVTSDLVGLGLNIPGLSYHKAAKTAGKLQLEASLGPNPKINAFSLTAGELSAKGSLTTKADQSIDKIIFDKLALGKWLDVRAELTGHGRKKDLSIALTGGTIDLSKRGQGTGAMGGGSAGGASPTISVALDQVIITDTLRLRAVSGSIRPVNGGLDGAFNASLNGVSRISGTMTPYHGSTAYHITSQDAGRAIAAAGIFKQGRGGTLDLTLTPLPLAGGHKNAAGGTASSVYRGHAVFHNLSVQNAPALAELLAAASVVGLLEQMQGQGIVFNEGDVTFDLLPQGVQIHQGAAVGAAIGISFEGYYRQQNSTLDIQGTISPVYLLNSVGAILSRKGEGLFGFTYQLSGPVSQPKVSVNPLSILTPGKFRDIFRRPAPQLRKTP